MLDSSQYNMQFTSNIITEQQKQSTFKGSRSFIGYKVNKYSGSVLKFESEVDQENGNLVIDYKIEENG